MKPIYTLKRDPSLKPMYDPMDLNATRSYAPLETDERRTRAINGECFGYSRKDISKEIAKFTLLKKSAIVHPSL